MVLTFAMHGNHNKQVDFSSDADVEAGFEFNGIAFSELVERCRDPEEPVPFFENLLPSGWTVTPGVQVSVIDSSTGNVRAQLGPAGGKLFPDRYAATFEHAHAEWLGSIRGASPIKFLSAATAGVAAVESYILHRARIWNDLDPPHRLVDSQEKKVSFDDKVDVWVPKMTGGIRLKKDDVVWADFRIIRALRDDEWIHQKESSLAIDLDDLALQLNRFRSGIAMLLIRLHKLFQERIPRVVIRTAYSPEVRVAGTDVGNFCPQ